MKYRVVIHEVARDDIRRNPCWWADNHSKVQAESWFHNAFDRIESLSALPEPYPLAPENDDFPFDMPELHFGVGSRPSYRAVFVIRGDVVHVLSVRRAAQDRIFLTDSQLDL